MDHRGALKKSSEPHSSSSELANGEVRHGIKPGGSAHRVSAQEKNRFLELLKKKGTRERQYLFRLMETPLTGSARKANRNQHGEDSTLVQALEKVFGEDQPTLLTAIYTKELKRGVFGVIDDRVVVEKAREGLPFAEFERLARLLDLTVPEQAALFSITERTMARRIAERGTLHSLESERLVLLQKLAEHGVEVFEDIGKFNRWLRRSLPMLGDRSPLQYLDMTTGFVVVEQVLGRLAHGVYS